VVEGDIVNWYETLTSTSPILVNEDTLRVPNIVETKTYYATNTIYTAGFRDQMGKTYTEADSTYGNLDFSGAIVLNAKKSFKIESFKAFTSVPGPRKLLLKNRFGHTLDSEIIDFKYGSHRYNCDLLVPELDLVDLTTDEEMNEINFGTRSPKLGVSYNNIELPYEVEGIGGVSQIMELSGGYPYFFDMTISSNFTICESEKFPVTAYWDRDLATSNPILGELTLFPNPATNILEISPDIKGEISIMNMQGEKTKIFQNGRTLDISSLPAGVYWLSIIAAEKTYAAKFVKL
jgi:hypothetical protein